MPIDERGWKPEPFERARGARITERRARAEELVGCERYAFIFAPLASAHAGFRRVAIDAAPHEFGDQARVPDGFRAALDEEAREKDVVDEAVTLAGGDRCVHLTFIEPFARKPRSELHLRQATLREKAEGNEAGRCFCALRARFTQDRRFPRRRARARWWKPRPAGPRGSYRRSRRRRRRALRGRL